MAGVHAHCVCEFGRVCVFVSSHLKGVEVARVHFKGLTKGRGFALRGITGAGIRISHLCDITPIHSNGTRPRKSRRL